MYHAGAMWLARFRRLKWLAIAAGVSLPLFLVAIVQQRGPISITCFIAALLLLVPGLFYFYILTIWHWKDRYDGKHSDLWGALLLIETTGWFKVLYLFRHLLPDALETIRYGDSKAPNSDRSLLR